MAPWYLGTEIHTRSPSDSFCPYEQCPQDWGDGTGWEQHQPWAGREGISVDEGRVGPVSDVGQQERFVMLDPQDRHHDTIMGVKESEL